MVLSRVYSRDLMLYLDCGLLVRAADLYRLFNDQHIDERAKYGCEEIKTFESINLEHFKTCTSSIGPVEASLRPSTKPTIPALVN